VSEVRVDVENKTVRVVGAASDEAVRAAMDEAGYEVASLDDDAVCRLAPADASILSKALVPAPPCSPKARPYRGVDGGTPRGRMRSDTVSQPKARMKPSDANQARPRRVLAGVVGMALVLAACGGGSKPAATIAPTSPSGYTVIQAQSNLPVGPSRFVFGIADPNNNPVAGGQPAVLMAKDQHTAAVGPFAATWQTWGPPRGDSFGTANIPGFFTAQVTVTRPGNWLVLVRDTVGGKAIEAGGTIPVVAHPVAAVGSPALSEATPVATTPADEAKIDTRQPPTPMHYISLDAALRSGMPTVLVFATPQFCQSRLCGPVVDEVLTVYERVGTARANFVDVEIYPTHDLDKPAPEFLRWGFESEPWVLVIDRDGIIRARFEGPSVASEIQAALTPLLAA